MVTCNLKKSWINIEMEHGLGKAMAKKIACDHVKEFPGYYPALKKMEQKLRKK